MSRANPTPDWLKHLRADIERLTIREARRHWPGENPEGLPYYNYRLEHFRQVERDARRLLAQIPADEEVILAAVWIHDRFQAQYQGEEHGHRAANWAEDNLERLGFPKGKTPQVAYVVAHHSDPPGEIPADRGEARLLWDADKLSKIGPLSVVTYLLAAPAFPQTRVDFQGFARRGYERIASCRPRLAQFYYEPSRQIARRRFAALKAFYQALGEETGVETGRSG